MFRNSKQKKIKINLTDYEHAIEFIQLTNQYDANFDIRQNRMFVDGKSLLGVLSLDLSKDIFLYLDNDFDEKVFEKFKRWERISFSS